MTPLEAAARAIFAETGPVEVSARAVYPVRAEALAELARALEAGPEPWECRCGARNGTCGMCGQKKG